MRPRIIPSLPLKSVLISGEHYEAAVEIAKQIKWYYLFEADNPPVNTFVSIGTNAFSQEWPRDERAFEWLAESFNMDKVPASGLAHMGNMRRLGIEKGKPFNPDDRAKKILKRAAKTAEAMVLSMSYNDRVTENTYDNRQYGPIFFSENPDFYTENYEEVEGRVAQYTIGRIRPKAVLRDSDFDCK